MSAMQLVHKWKLIRGYYAKLFKFEELFMTWWRLMRSRSMFGKDKDVGFVTLCLVGI